MGRAAAGELRLAALVGDVVGVGDGDERGDLAKRRIGMPHLVAARELRHLVVGAPPGAVLADVADGPEVIHDALAPEPDVLHFRFAQPPGEGELRVVVERLVGEDEEGMAVDGVAHDREVAPGRRRAEVDADDPGAEIAMQGFDRGLGHGGLRPEDVARPSCAESRARHTGFRRPRGGAPNRSAFVDVDSPLDGAGRSGHRATSA